jgi:hypothetical protein
MPVSELFNDLLSLFLAVALDIIIWMKMTASFQLEKSYLTRWEVNKSMFKMKTRMMVNTSLQAGLIFFNVKIIF